MKALALAFFLAASFDADQEREVSEWSEGRPRSSQAVGAIAVVLFVAGTAFAIGRFSR
jgi:hypothetical protein